MGSFISSSIMCRNTNVTNNKKCYTCSKSIDDKTYIICVRCKIALHNDCEVSYGNKYFTVCPQCDRCGSLGTIHAPNNNN
jgi:hypothetical protein